MDRHLYNIVLYNRHGRHATHPKALIYVQLESAPDWPNVARQTGAVFICAVEPASWDRSRSACTESACHVIRTTNSTVSHLCHIQQIMTLELGRCQLHQASFEGEIWPIFGTAKIPRLRTAEDQRCPSRQGRLRTRDTGGTLCLACPSSIVIIFL